MQGRGLGREIRNSSNAMYLGPPRLIYERVIGLVLTFIPVYFIRGGRYVLFLADQFSTLSSRLSVQETITSIIS